MVMRGMSESEEWLVAALLMEGFCNRMQNSNARSGSYVNESAFCGSLRLVRYDL